MKVKTRILKDHLLRNLAPMKNILKILSHSVFAVIVLAFNIYTTRYFADIIVSTGSMFTVLLILMIMVSINTVTIYSYLSYHRKVPKMRKKKF